MILAANQPVDFTANSTTPFWSTDALRSIAGIVRGDDGYRSNPCGFTNLAVVKTDLISTFMQHELPVDWRGIVISSDSDTPFTQAAAHWCDDPRVVCWFAVNLAASHSKLHALPMGIPDSRRPFMAWDAVAKVLRAASPNRHARTELITACYNSATGGDRQACMLCTGICPQLIVPHARYFDTLTRSFFVLCPTGNGYDCWRTAEALYCGAVPVVTSHSNEGIRIAEALKDLPVVILESWEDYRADRFTAELHASLWAGKPISDLMFEPLFRHYLALAGVTVPRA